jgi:hypothetical protein
VVPDDYYRDIVAERRTASENQEEDVAAVVEFLDDLLTDYDDPMQSYI